MSNALPAAVFVTVCPFVFSGPALAHHGGGAFDAAHPMTMTGTVKEFLFIQPHPLITLEVKDDKGVVTEWSVETTAPNHLVHYGWNGKKPKLGDQITIAGLPSKNGLKVLNFRKISWANGEVIPLGLPPEPGQ